MRHAIGRWQGWTLVALLAAALGGATACTRVVEAVSAEGCAAHPGAPGCSPTSWPTTGQGANSDPWIVQHHDTITQMSPRVLVLNFSNSATADSARQTAERQIAAIAEGSRYHAYSDSSAPIFLNYQIARVVDLADHPIPPGWTQRSSTQLPVIPMPNVTPDSYPFDSQALFSAPFSASYGFTDPANPARYLSLCELFEQGFINEVWIEDGEDGPRHAPYNAERKQIYDAQNRPVPNTFDPCAGGGGCLPDVDCSVTVRIAHLNPQRGAGCDLDVRGWSLESIPDTLPAFAAEASAFLNHDFRSRFAVGFNSWSNICDFAETTCVTYPTPTSATGTYNGMPWTINPLIQGCGNTSFPPNARARYDWHQTTAQVQSRCEHFGLHDGVGGADAMEIYTSLRINDIERVFGTDCGAGWQIYWRQSVPGLGNKATTTTGLPMRNWWPLLFY